MSFSRQFLNEAKHAIDPAGRKCGRSSGRPRPEAADGEEFDKAEAALFPAPPINAGIGRPRV
jgi:hypothetical protein